MADISKEIQQIEKAVYGEEVRGSIRDAILKINVVAETSDSKADDAVAQVGQAREEIAEALEQANTTLEEAKQAEQIATTKAEEASASASAATSAMETATTKAEEAGVSASTATSAAQTATAKAGEASTSASTATNAMEMAKAKAEEADSSASRAEEAANRAESVVGIGVATEEKAGIVKASQDVTVAPDGTLGINLTIGGRNLAKETNQGSKNWGWSLETGNRIVESEIVDGINCVKLTKTEDVLAGGWNFVFYKNFERNRIKPSTEYVLSFEVRSNKVLSINADLTKKNGTDYLTETSKVLQGKVDGNNTWTKVVFLLKTYSKLPTPTDQVIYLRGFNSESGAIHYIRNLMLEEGNKPSSYTPAIEDFQDQINSIQNPEFNDSGTVEGISNFTDFLNSVKSKMNIFQFFKNFKAGMKYVLHTGRLANNVTTTQEGFALDARMGKTLQDQITDVNKNIDNNLQMKIFRSFSSIGLSKTFSLLDVIKAMPDNSILYAVCDLGVTITDIPDALGILEVQRLNNNRIQLHFTSSENGKMYERFYKTALGDFTGEWEMLITNSDFKRTIEIRLPYIAFGGKLYASYAFPVRLDSIPKVTLDDYYIDGIGHVDSFRNYLVNQEEVVFEFTKSDMNFELGKCYIGRTRFTIS